MKKEKFWVIVALVGFWLAFSLSSNDEVKLGNNYIYDAEHQHIIGAIDIPPVIINYKYNEKFIVAKQSPTAFDNVIYDKMKYDYYLGRDTIYYWIIYKQTMSIFYFKISSIRYSISNLKETNSFLLGGIFIDNIEVFGTVSESDLGVLSVKIKTALALVKSALSKLFSSIGFPCKYFIFISYFPA